MWSMELKFQHHMGTFQLSSVQSLSRVRLFLTPWIAARQASLSIANSQSSLKLMSIESVMPSSHLILCRPLLLLPPIPPSIRVFSSDSTLRMRWPKYWSFSFYISPSSDLRIFQTICVVGLWACSIKIIPLFLFCLLLLDFLWWRACFCIILFSLLYLTILLVIRSSDQELPGT